MRRRNRPGVVDLRRYRAASSKKAVGRGEGRAPGPWISWAVLLGAATVWALVRMVGAGGLN